MKWLSPESFKRSQTQLENEAAGISALGLPVYGEACIRGTSGTIPGNTHRRWLWSDIREGHLSLNDLWNGFSQKVLWNVFVITSELSRKSQEKVWNLTCTQHSVLFSCSPSVGYDGSDFNCWAKHFNSNQFSQIENHLLADSSNGAPYWDQHLGTKGRNLFHGETHGNALRWMLR